MGLVWGCRLTRLLGGDVDDGAVRAHTGAVVRPHADEVGAASVQLAEDGRRPVAHGANHAGRLLGLRLLPVPELGTHVRDHVYSSRIHPNRMNRKCQVLHSELLLTIHFCYDK